jgi:hypothetical protein
MFRLAGFPAALSLLVCAGAVAAPLAAAAVPVVSATIHVGSDPQGVAVNSRYRHRLRGQPRRHGVGDQREPMTSASRGHT